ncbi:MAG TPA: GTPase HflX [bacterium]|nr:GTPase HflX [bacterium]
MAATTLLLERVILARVLTAKEEKLAAPLNELASLACTAGAIVAGQLVQKREQADATFFIGRGKVDELKQLVDATGAMAVIFDNPLSPSQERNLKQEIGVPVLNRTELIIHIFAQRAHTQEAKLQVELAALSYRLTRLSAHGESFAQQIAVVGMRGPGEKKLEYDRRTIQKQIDKLKVKLDSVICSRREQRKGRQGKPVCALVGYTNAGKSALLNALTGSSKLVEDKLFATLDPAVRRYRLPDGTTVLISDTVGFISNLPPQLVAAFRATLEEVQEADLLLHTIDIAEPGVEERVAEVMRTLKELKAERKPMVAVLNKVDLVPSRIRVHKYRKYPHAVAVSARTGEGLDKLAEMMGTVLRQAWVPARVALHHTQQRVALALIEPAALVTKKEYSEDGSVLLMEFTAAPEFLESLRTRGYAVELLSDDYAWRTRDELA